MGFMKTQACIVFLLIGWLFVIPAQAQPTDIDMKLAFAIYNDESADTVAHLIGRGANANIVINNGWTPLHYSVSKSSDSSVTLLLLKNGADINAVNSNKDTPLHLAARHNLNDSVIFLLIENGANIKCS